MQINVLRLIMFYHFQGSYKCGACKAGYIGNGYSGCIPGNFCDTSLSDCHSNATCTSQGSGRYTCEVMNKDSENLGPKQKLRCNKSCTKEVSQDSLVLVFSHRHSSCFFLNKNAFFYHEKYERRCVICIK